MSGISDDRALWLGLYIVPEESALRAWLRKRPRGELDVDDIVQETYAILAARDSVDDIRNPKNYAFQVAYSIVQAHLRRSRIVAFRSLADIDALGISSDAPSPEHQALDRDDLRLVEEFMASLPARCREVLILRRVHELSYRDISERLGISENTVEKLIAKGVRLLMDAFGRGGKSTRHASSGVGISRVTGHK